jgi:hypothetical protein
VPKLSKLSCLKKPLRIQVVYVHIRAALRRFPVFPGHLAESLRVRFGAVGPMASWSLESSIPLDSSSLGSGIGISRLDFETSYAREERRTSPSCQGGPPRIFSSGAYFRCVPRRPLGSGLRAQFTVSYLRKTRSRILQSSKQYEPTVQAAR